MINLLQLSVEGLKVSATGLCGFNKTENQQPMETQKNIFLENKTIWTKPCEKTHRSIIGVETKKQ